MFAAVAFVTHFRPLLTLEKALAEMLWKAGFSDRGGSILDRIGDPVKADQEGLGV
jgi:hypothetical protein